MGYPYGTQNGPVVGAQSPGLPRRMSGMVGADPSGFPAAYAVVQSNQTIPVPSWATYARLGVTGNGGLGFSTGGSEPSGGGGGGGFSGTNTIRVSAGQSVTFTSDSVANNLEGLGYRLIARHGATATSRTGAAGGTASGGDINYTGGNGGNAAGGGTGSSGAAAAGGGSAAGRGGPGITGSNTTGGTGSSAAGANGSVGTDHLSGSSPGGSGVVGATSQFPASVGASATTSLGNGLIIVGTPASGSPPINGGPGAGSGGQNYGTGTPYPMIAALGFALVEFW